MKKIIIFMFCFIFVLLCGCNKESSDVTVVTTGLSFTAETEAEDFLSECIVEIGTDGTFNINFLKPQNIEGMQVSVSNGKMAVNYKGLTYSENISVLPEGAVTNFLYSVFLDIRLKERKVQKQNDEFYISGNTGKYDYKMSLGETGLPIRITNKSGINICIKNASVANE